jgi:type VI secretion system secreted protein VgrG
MSRQVTAAVHCGGSAVAPAADLLRIVLRQSIFGHHSFEVAVPFDQIEGSMAGFFQKAHKRLLGQPLTLQVEADAFHFNQGQQLQFKGLVTRLETGRDNDYTGTFVLRAYSPCYLLASGLKKRTFVKQTLSAIFNQVLQPFPVNLLARTIKPQHQEPLPYVVQYQETNFDFLSRLAAEYGEWFYYDGKTLQLGAPPAGGELDFVADGAYNGFTFGLGIKPTTARLYEYNYQKHEHFTSASQSQSLPSVQNHLYGGFALTQSEALFSDASHVSAETLVHGRGQLDGEARAYKAYAAADLVTVDGYSDNPSLRLGGVIRIHGEGLGSRTQVAESFGTYRILELTHHVDGKGNYNNRFVAVPHLLEVAPINPFYDAPTGTSELAEVIDAKDPKQLGRVRVRYYWPVDNKQHAETDWLRVLTPYSGAGKGQLFTPEVGSQVLLGYQNGLAEQPYVQGNLFHAKNKAKAKYTHNGGEVKGIQTLAGNRVTFHDKKGEEKIVITNGNKKETALEISFKGDGKIELKTKGDISLAAGKNVAIQAGENVSLEAGEMTLEAKTIQAKADSTVEVGAASAQLKMAGATTQVKGTLTQG